MTELSEYLDYSKAPDQLTGGVRRIPISTPKGNFSVWVKRVGSHLSQYDDPRHFFPGLVQFLRDVDDEKF